jgi:hypothetical protein
MNEILLKIQRSIKGKRLSLGDEKRLQGELETGFLSNDIKFEREVHLDKNNIVDFMIDGLAIEIKIKSGGSSMQIYRQLERYAEFSNVEAILLMTAKAISLPESINGKQIFVLSLSRTQL